LTIAGLSVVHFDSVGGFWGYPPVTGTFERWKRDGLYLEIEEDVVILLEMLKIYLHRIVLLI
jgi:hypothetical protein